MKRIVVTSLSFLMLGLCCCAQEVETVMEQDDDWQSDFEDLILVEDMPEETSQNMFETLEYLKQHPINLNTATQEDLQQIPFLTDKQIEDILYYIYHYGKMKSTAELMMIESLGYETRNLLKNFVVIDSTTPKKFPKIGNILEYGKQDVSYTFKYPFYTRKGDEKGYLGYKLKHALRYNFQYGNYVRFGIVGANNAGEPFFGRNKMGYDHYSYYFVLKNLGALKSLALGCYKVSFGLGLVVSNGMNFGKASTLTSLGKTTNNIRAHVSQSESNYFNGVAATVEIMKGLQLTGFLSNRNLDATLASDSNSITSFVTNGYHRTQTEWDKKGNTNEKTAGGNINFQMPISGNQCKANLGLTAVYSHLDRDLQPRTTGDDYRKYYPKGSDFFNIGANYGVDLYNWSLRGEVAMNRDNALACVNKLSFTPSYSLKIMALQRFFSYKYTSLHARTFSENSSPQNESGLYLGAEWNPSAKWNVLAYTDWFYFPWMKSGVSESSYGTDNLVQATCSLEKVRLYGRYHLKIKQKDSDLKNGLRRNVSQRLRFACDYNLQSPLTFKTQVDGSLINFDEQNWGYMISQNMNYDNKKWLKLNMSVGYFKSTDYDSRLYTYEKNMTYEYSFPSYYGNGIRFALYAQYYIKDKLQIAAKVGHTSYFDRDVIGSSYQQIDQSYQTDLDMQIIWKF